MPSVGISQHHKVASSEKSDSSVFWIHSSPHASQHLLCYVFGICLLTTNKYQKYKSVELGDQLHASQHLLCSQLGILLQTLLTSCVLYKSVRKRESEGKVFQRTLFLSCLILQDKLFWNTQTSAHFKHCLVKTQIANTKHKYLGNMNVHYAVVQV